jgi:uncharacterized membrane protein YcaP (DUF421 family)
MHDLFFHTDIPIWNLIIRGVVVYFGIVLLLRISGKRQVGQMGATELATILLISNAVQNSMNGGDNSLMGGMILAGVLIALGSMLTYLTYRKRIFRVIFEGRPTLLVHHGKVIEKAMCAERITRTDLTILMRKQGIHKLSEIQTAILETDGSLSLLHVDEKPLPAHTT